MASILNPLPGSIGAPYLDSGSQPLFCALAEKVKAGLSGTLFFKPFNRGSVNSTVDEVPAFVTFEAKTPFLVFVFSV